MNRDVILLVDDNPVDIYITEKAILKSRPGSVIRHAANGGEALDFLRKGNPPVLIFLDYKMPGMTGVDVLNDIRMHAETRYLSVVMLSSSNFDSDIRSALDAGANGYLTKTHNFDAFTEEINTVLRYWLDLNRSPNGAS